MILPAIDAHAHVLTSVGARDLADLDALVFAVTRDSSEWKAALARRDDLTLWGIGVHPGLPEAIEQFDQRVFDDAARRSLLVGEVGLDGRSKVPADRQRLVLDAILETLMVTRRPVTIHSASASGPVLDSLRRRPVAAPILHWWRGSVKQTQEAIELGCFFSLNGAEARRPKVIDLLPPDRVLTETDFPHSRRSDPAATRPAAVGTIEQALMERWSVDQLGLRRQLWRNLAALYERCALIDSLPPAALDAMLTAGLG